MIRLYPSCVQFHCGVIAGACCLLAGMAGYNYEWAWAGVFTALAIGSVAASSIIAIREG